MAGLGNIGGKFATANLFEQDLYVDGTGEAVKAGIDHDVTQK